MPSGVPWRNRLPLHLPEIHNPLPLLTLRGDLSALHASLVETVEDIVASLDNLAPARFPRTPSRPFMADDPADLPDRPAEKRDVILSTGDHVSLSVRSPEPTSDPTPPGGGTLIKRICERLVTEPLLVDELILQCHANSSEMQHSLLELELEGRIERHPWNRVSLATS